MRLDGCVIEHQTTSIGYISWMNMDRIVFFDGVCNLCSSSVQFILKRDKREVFQFASLQSEAGQKALEMAGYDPAILHSVLLKEDNRWYNKSSAALRIARHLSGAWPMLYAFIIIPKFLRDGVYDFIGRHRYRWFGKKETCWIPQPKWKKRFIDQQTIPA